MELSFCWHPFTAEHPLVSKWCNAKFIRICSDEETNSSTSWMAWEWVKFQQMFVFSWNIPLRCMADRVSGRALSRRCLLASVRSLQYQIYNENTICVIMPSSHRDSCTSSIANKTIVFSHNYVTPHKTIFKAGCVCHFQNNVIWSKICGLTLIKKCKGKKPRRR